MTWISCFCSVAVKKLICHQFHHTLHTRVLIILVNFTGQKMSCFFFSCELFLAKSQTQATPIQNHRSPQKLDWNIRDTQLRYPLRNFLRHPFNICRQHKTVKDVIGHHQTPANAIWCQPKPPHILEQPFWVSGNVCWCCLVSVGVCCCPELSQDTWRRCLRAFGWSVCM